MVGIYVILAQGLNLVAGLSGMVSVMHAAYYGIGAYVSAIASRDLDLAFGASWCLAGLAAAVLGFVLSGPLVRLEGDYFALATFGLGLIIFDVLNNWVSLTQGPMGLPGIPQPFTRTEAWLLFVIVVAGGATAVGWLVARSPFGRLLKATGDDPELCAQLGKNVPRARLASITVGAGLAGLAGSIYAHYVTFVDPSSFTAMESVNILAMVIVGGLGRAAGSVVGPAFFVLLPEALRFVGLPADLAAALRQTLFGLLLVTVVVWRPAGVARAPGA